MDCPLHREAALSLRDFHPSGGIQTNDEPLEFATSNLLGSKRVKEIVLILGCCKNNGDFENAIPNLGMKEYRRNLQV